MTAPFKCASERQRLHSVPRSLCIVGGLAVLVERPAEWDFLTLQQGGTDFAKGHHRRRHVQHKEYVLAAGNSHANRIGGEHGFDAGGGQNGHTSVVGQRNPDHVVRQTAHGVIGRHPKVTATAHGDDVYAIFLRFGNAVVHGLDPDHQPQTTIAIDQCGNRRFAAMGDVWARIQIPYSAIHPHSAKDC